jgi:hypothetical protein
MSLKANDIKLKENFSLTKEAHAFAKSLIDSKCSLNSFNQFAKLGFAIGINFKEHIENDVATQNIADTKSIDSDGSLLFIYLNKYPEFCDETQSTWINIERVASYGLKVIETNYFDKDENLIEWEQLYKDFGS